MKRFWILIAVTMLISVSCKQQGRTQVETHADEVDQSPAVKAPASKDETPSNEDATEVSAILWVLEIPDIRVLDFDNQKASLSFRVLNEIETFFLLPATWNYPADLIQKTEVSLPIGEAVSVPGSRPSHLLNVMLGPSNVDHTKIQIKVIRTQELDGGANRYIVSLPSDVIGIAGPLLSFDIPTNGSVFICPHAPADHGSAIHYWLDTKTKTNAD